MGVVQNHLMHLVGLNTYKEAKLLLVGYRYLVAQELIDTKTAQELENLIEEMKQRKLDYSEEMRKMKYQEMEEEKQRISDEIEKWTEEWSKELDKN
ncbi:hypothetical protein [Bacillus sp. CGMCC 1.16541]|uniref:hypothetical protein n=1 Tax=Bacillus sp. CGMCC 1.16541 TaxID=2185143 RepID=UPI000D727429|nr:hypothetical protein [Bacillus sp. CGMCC 1.16541]